MYACPAFPVPFIPIKWCFGQPAFFIQYFMTFLKRMLRAQYLWRVGSQLFSNSSVFTCGFFKTRSLIIEPLLWLPLYDPRSALARKLSWPSLFGDWLGGTVSPNHRGRGWCSPIDLHSWPFGQCSCSCSTPLPLPVHSQIFFLRSLRGRRSKGKGKVTPFPKTPFPFPFKRLPRRLFPTVL